MAAKTLKSLAARAGQESDVHTRSPATVTATGQSPSSARRWMCPLVYQLLKLPTAIGDEVKYNIEATSASEVP